ncbi:hypothetical protein [Amnibacterium setariae]|uniref:Glycosyltransferase RgtA/B/C/D-like domain-containing protein n=1 Tax=Amnibacterium setariae TaxID=2306585 RepID=A0A3A1TWW6_9MICO|nr:hypothetical protein [Amnibacterium setariae]RIX28299.1 hypothetical protein D1781_12680 [Amnibacterium setariae]
MEAQGRRRETSRHRSPSRFALPRPVGRAAAVLTPVLSLLPAVVLLVVVQSLSPVAQRVPTGAARFDLAGAWLASAPGALAGTTSWLPAPTLGRLQLGGLLHLLQGGTVQGVLAAAHGAMLLLAVAQAVLVWWVLRRLGAGGVAAGLATAVFGVASIAVEAHATVSAVAVAAVWLLLAVGLALGRTVPALVAAGVSAAVAAASAPVVLLAVAPLAVLLVLRLRGRTGEARHPLVAAGAGFGAGAVLLAGGMAAVAALPATAATARLDALTSAEPPGAGFGAAAGALWLRVDPVSLVVALAAVVLAVVGARDRGVAVVAAVLALAAFWPLGGDAAVPLVLLLPVVAAATARAADVGVAALGHPMFVRSVLGSAWLTAVGAVLVTAVVVWLVGLTGLVRGPDQPLARAERWIRTSVPAGQTVLVPLGAWPDLAASGRADVGWYAALPDGVPSSPSWRRADYVVVDAALADRPTGAAAAALDRSAEAASFGTGATRLAVRAVRAPAEEAAPPQPTTAAGREAARIRRTVGAQLAGNPRVEVAGQDRARLLQGQVDTRIALVLAQFVTAHSITISGFGTVPGDDSGVRTAVTVSEIDGRRVPGDGTKTGVLLRFLSDLRGDFATRSIDATDDGITAVFAPDPDLVPNG